MDLGGKCVSFEEGFDFVIEEATEDLQDGHGLVSDLEIPARTDDYEDRRLYLLVSDLEVMRTCNGFEAMQAEASSWMRACFWNACLDMLAMDKEDDFRVMWLDASKDTNFGGGRQVQCNR